MERDILDLQFEIKAWELKRATLRRELEAHAGTMSDIMLCGYRTAIADCDANIAGLRDEMEGPRGQRPDFIGVDDPADHLDSVDAVPIGPWDEFIRVIFGRKVTDVQCEIMGL